MAGGYRSIEYNGKTYRYNNRVTSILYAGIDSEDEIRAAKAFVGAPRADSISLVVMDERNDRMTIIALSRDTMTGIHKFTVDGKDRGAFTDHLAFAYTYGDGGEVSCKNLCRAVSDLLFGIPIDGYVVSNRASLPILGEAIGPVEVVVPNEIVRDEMEHIKGSIISTLKLYLHNNAITLTMRVAEQGEREKILTRREQFQLMCSQNPAVEKLLQAFDLELA
jgi:anionic cell wall polymer biosynthesis LytR-Cps2A-Psr (LCP) family protein